MTTITLGKLFHLKDETALVKHIKAKDKDKILAFLSDRKSYLRSKGIDYKYMYYVICYQFNIL